MLAKTSVERNPALSRDTRNMTITVEATLDDGSVVTRACSKPPGFWGEPVDPEMHRNKIHDCLACYLDQTKIKEVINCIENLEKLSAQQTKEFIALLA